DRAIDTRRQVGGKWAKGEGNVGYLEGVVDGKRVSLEAPSGKQRPKDAEVLVPDPKSRQFKTRPSGFQSRDYDSEVLLLEHVAKDLSPDSTGTLRLYSERRPCKQS